MTDNTRFDALALPAEMISNLNDLGYTQMTPVQAQSLPLVLDGRDLIAKAKTGSGKTAAFGIGLLMQLDPHSFDVQALVLCPTRELATQVTNELRKLARFRANLKIVTLCGGQPIGPQIGSLQHGAHVVVGTPGRISDHLRKKTLHLNRLRTLVLDEADRMLEMGFSQDIRGIADQTPTQRQTLLFSATYPEEIAAISSDYQRDPAEVSVESIHTNDKITQCFFEVERDNKSSALTRLLRYYRPQSCVVFCNTKQQCQDLSQSLYEAGFSARALQGDMDQRQRDQVLVQFANRSVSILVATDVAARGLDIDDLDLVVNYELSRSPDVYVHRIGRTGRAGKEGVALSLCTPSEAYKVNAIEDYCQQRATFSDLESIRADMPAPEKPAMVTLCIAAGRKNKIRPGDILGALTGEQGIAGDLVGKINIFDFCAYVAVNRDVSRNALKHLEQSKIKGRKYKVRRV